MTAERVGTRPFVQDQSLVLSPLSGSIVPVLMVALGIAVLSITPMWRAQAQVLPGWTFTGNLSGSPDMMQYRVWMRQTRIEGMIVTNKFTVEPNSPHLPVVLYYVLGQIGTWLKVEPEFVYGYAAAVLAFALTTILFLVIQKFLPIRSQAWWVFLVVLLGGGLGAHLKILSGINAMATNPVVNWLLVKPAQAWPLFEDYRGNYVFFTLFDTHFLLIWVAATAAVGSLYFALERPSAARTGLTGLLCIAVTVLHVYEGFTLLAILAGVGILLWVKKLLSRERLVVLGAAAFFLFLSLAALWLLQKNSGLPLPTWRGVNILFSTLLIAYPLGWALVAWGIGRYWKGADLRQTFLLGWLLGCTALTLSGPFFPYPDRGTMTLQIPLYMIAGTIYFGQFRRVTWPAALILISVLGASPALELVRAWNWSAARSNEPAVFMSSEHVEVVRALNAHALSSDVLIVDKSDAPWQTDDLWLAPEFPGKLYCGHFFLTVEYERKCAQANHFFGSTPAEQAAFLRHEKVRYVYVAAAQSPQRFETVPGLVVLRREPIGTLFEYPEGASQ